MPYFVYILLCADNTYYTGITTNLDRRLIEHNIGSKGARYTRSRRPLTLVYQESQPNRSLAQQREYQLRTLSHTAKTNLISV